MSKVSKNPMNRSDACLSCRTKILVGGRVLKAGVAVGVAVDLDARKIFFASDGNWDESPAFDEEDSMSSQHALLSLSIFLYFQSFRARSTDSWWQSCCMASCLWHMKVEIARLRPYNALYIFIPITQVILCVIGRCDDGQKGMPNDWTI